MSAVNLSGRLVYNRFAPYPQLFHKQDKRVQLSRHSRSVLQIGENL